MKVRELEAWLFYHDVEQHTNNQSSDASYKITRAAFLEELNIEEFLTHGMYEQVAKGHFVNLPLGIKVIEKTNMCHCFH